MVVEEEDRETGSISGDSRSFSPAPGAPLDAHSCSPSPSRGVATRLLQLWPRTAIPAVGSALAQWHRTISESGRHLAGEADTLPRRLRPRRPQLTSGPCESARCDGGELPQAASASTSLQRRPGHPAAPPARGGPDAARQHPATSTVPRRRAAGRLTVASRPSVGGPGGRQRQPASARAGSATRSRSFAGDGVRRQQLGPCEDNCFAVCLAEGVDLARLESSWKEDCRRRARLVAEQAAAARAAGLEDEEAAETALASAGVEYSFHIQLVRMMKEFFLMKIGRKDCFVFGFGCLVCWGCTASELNKAKEVLKPFLLKELTSDFEEDHLDIVPREGTPPQVLPSAREPTCIFERISLAYALAQSVRLGPLEQRIARTISNTRTIPQTMERTGDIKLKSRKLTQMMGELMLLRTQLNLELDILDTPNVFWEYADFEPLYQFCREHLEIDSRVSILNQRFEVLQDLFDVLEGELNERRESRLMWLIIGLCAVEAIVMAFRYLIRVEGGASANGRPFNSQHAVSLKPVRVAILCAVAWLGKGLAQWPAAKVLGWSLGGAG